MPPTTNKPQRAAKPKGEALKEFLNPHSMLTPGLCGGVTMLITNTLAAQFGAPPNYTALAVSFLFGLIVFAATATTLWLRLVFWLLNSLIIFSIGLGTNQVGVKASKNVTAIPVTPMTIGPSNLPSEIALGGLKKFFANWLDGTVPRRTDLIAKIQGLDDSAAEKALNHLTGTSSNSAAAKSILEKTASSAQTLSEVADVENAVAKVDSPNSNLATITEYSPGTTITLKEASGPTQYRITGDVKYTTASGKDLDQEAVKTRIKAGEPVHVYYTGQGSEKMVDHIVLPED